MKDGIINIYKPTNMTSQDVVSIVRKCTGIKKVGHTGTLDPMATGVLPVCIGKATRIMDYLNFDLKTYQCTLELGKTSTTQDIWGEIVNESKVTGVTESMIYEAFNKFKGLIEQSPPMYSALKYNGKKLYEYARSGIELPKDIKRRQTYIEKIDILEIDLSIGKVTFDVACSKGTYIRTICQDVGEILGCGAVMTSLERRASGVFSVSGAISIDDIKSTSEKVISQMGDISNLANYGAVTVDYPLVNMGIIVVGDDGKDKFINGVHVPTKICKIKEQPHNITKELRQFGSDKLSKSYKLYYDNNFQTECKTRNLEFLGVAYYDDKYKKIVADKVFYRE